MQFKQDINDKRNSIRVDFKVPVEIYCAETDDHVDGEMINLSVHGMLVRLNTKDPGEVVGTRKKCLGRIVFFGKGSILMIDKLAATVVRIESNRVGLEFDRPLEWFLLFNVYKGKQLQD